MDQIEEQSKEDSQSELSAEEAKESIKVGIEPPENLRKESVQNDQNELVSEKNIKVFETSQDKHVNLRGKMWLLVCKVEDLKQKLLDEF